MTHTIDVIAAHRLEVPDQGAASVVHVGAALAADLPSDVLAQLTGYLTNLDRRGDDAGPTTPAWWDTAKPAQIANLESCAVDAFDDASRAAMERLRARTPPSAASGLVLFLRGMRDGGASILAVLKMSPGQVSHAQFQPSATTAAHAITVQVLQNVLPEPRELRKAAMLPNPSGPPLRVVDVDLRTPASYWMSFLGASARPRPKAIARMLADTAVAVLVSEGLERPAARTLVASVVEATAATTAAVVPRTFLDAVASRAQKRGDEVWDLARQHQPTLASTYAEATPLALGSLTTEFDLGDGVFVRGPTAVLDQRVLVDQDDNGWFVEVRATSEPEPRNF